MNFASFEFAGFCGLAVLALNLIRHPAWRAALVLLLNLAFAASFVPSLAQALPLALFILLGYGAILLAPRVNGVIFAFLLGIVIVAFIWLKGYSFANFMPSLPFVYATIGLSYVLFRILHLLIDVHECVLAPPRPLDFFAYVFFFLAFVSGPIQRFESFESQLTNPKLPRSTAEVDQAFRRILHGLLLVAVVCQLTSYLFSHMQTRVLDDFPGAHAGVSLIVLFTAATLMFLIHLYLNFTGYMEIVIGTGLLCGFALPENFDKPYLAANFLDLWSRWHITLSNWFKYYLFNPFLKGLAERFGSPAAMPYLSVLAFFVAFGVMGVWHGSGWIFLFYGLFLGMGASINKLYQIEMAKRLGKGNYKALTRKGWYVRLSRAFTIAYFGVALTALWIPDAKAANFLSVKGFVLAVCALAGIAAFSLIADIVLSLITGVLPRSEPQTSPSRFAPFYMGLKFSALMALVAMIDAASAPEFVYKVF